MKQWIKYIAVILSFVIMANNVLTSSIMEVRASDAATISGNETGGEGGGTTGDETGDDITTGDEVTGDETGNDITTGDETAGDETGGDIENETGAWSVTVQYELNGGEDATGAFAETVYNAAEITGGYEELIYIQIAEEIPQRTGYVFGGWTCNMLNGEGTPGREFMAEKEVYAGETIVFTAVWEAVKEEGVTICFDYNGGDGENSSVIITSEDIDVNNLFTIYMPVDVPTYANHKFIGWLCSEDNISYGPEEAKDSIHWYDYVGKEITFTAQWEELETDLAQVTILYVSYDGSREQQIIQQADENETEFDLKITGIAATQEYYKFDGWLCSIDDSVYPVSHILEQLSWEEYAGKTITFTAEMVELPIVTVNFERHDGGVITQTIQQRYETDTSFEVNLPIDDSEEEGYTFAGWYCTNYGTFYSSDLQSITFLWEAWADRTISFTSLGDDSDSFEELKIPEVWNRLVAGENNGNGHFGSSDSAPEAFVLSNEASFKNTNYEATLRIMSAPEETKVRLVTKYVDDDHWGYISLENNESGDYYNWQYECENKNTNTWNWGVLNGLPQIHQYDVFHVEVSYVTNSTTGLVVEIYLTVNNLTTNQAGTIVLDNSNFIDLGNDSGNIGVGAGYFETEEGEKQKTDVCFVLDGQESTDFSFYQNIEGQSLTTVTNTALEEEIAGNNGGSTEPETGLQQMSVVYTDFGVQTIQQAEESELTFNLTLFSEVPTREGYKFNGWVWSMNDSLYPAGYVMENLNWAEYAGKTITCTADWIELPSVFIEFIRYDGEVITESIQQKEEIESTFNITMPTDDSEMEGYRFTGWLCNIDGVVYEPDVNSLTLLWEKCANQSITFTAQWEQLPSVTINYVNENGIITDTAIKKPGVNSVGFTINLPEDEPIREGYIFKGWLCSADNQIYTAGSAVENLSWEVYGNTTITLTTEWEQLPIVTVNYVNEEAVVTDIITIQKPGESTTSFLINLPEDAPVREGYTFKGWLCSADNQIYTAGSAVENLSWELYGGTTITFTSEWIELPNITLRFERRDGEVITEKIYRESEAETTFDIYLPVDDSVVEGFTFGGWNSTVGGSLYGPTGQTLTLSWEKYVNSTIAFVSESIENYSVYRETPEEWYRLTSGENNGNGHFGSVNPEAFLFANYTSTTNDVSAPFYATLKIMSAPSETRVRLVSKYIDDTHWGYISLEPGYSDSYNWGYEYKNGDISNYPSLSGLPEIHQHDIFNVKIIYAIWGDTGEVAYLDVIVSNQTTKQTGMVTIDNSDFIDLGNSVGKIGFGAGSFGSSQTTDLCFANVIVGEHSFANLVTDFSFYQNVEGQSLTTVTNAELEEEIAGTGGTEPEIKEYTVTFDTQGGTEVSSVTVEEDGIIEQPVNPKKEGYTFEGWYLEGTEYDFTTPITEDMTLTARWKINEYVVKFEDGAGSEISRKVVEYGELVENPGAPEKEGYIFMGWFLEENLYDFTTPVKENITLIARWEIKKYTITFVSGEMEIAAVIVQHNDIVTKPESPIKEGYVFVGWLLNGEVYDFTTRVTKDMILSAEWEKVLMPSEIEIQDGEEVSLSTGVRYHLGEGSWTVNGEGYTYSGNSNFYVTQSGNYTFTLKSEN